MSEVIPESSDQTGAVTEPNSTPQRRSKAPTILVVAATILAVVATFTTWVRTQALDTDEWVELSSEVLDEPEVQRELAEYLIDSLYETADLETEFEQILPEDFAGLAAIAAGALREPLTKAVQRLLDSSDVQQLWIDANRVAHETTVAILRDDTGDLVSASGGEVALELGALIREVGLKAGLSEDLVDRIPDDAGHLVIFESDELDKAQTAVKILDAMSWFLFVLVVALYALAVFFAESGRKIGALRTVGIGLIVAGVAELLVRGIGIRMGVDAVVEESSDRPLATVVAEISTGLLHQIAWTTAIYGVLIVLFALLIGPGRHATSVRRFIAPGFRSEAVVAAGTVLAVLLLLWWSPGRAFSNWTTGLVLIAMVVGAVIALRRSVLAESAEEGVSAG